MVSATLVAAPRIDGSPCWKTPSVYAGVPASRTRVLLLSPFAPHTAEELWERLGNAGGLAVARWPVFDPDVARAQEIEVPVQVNGRVRARLVVPADASEAVLRERALDEPSVRTHTAGKTIKNVIVARGRLISIVVQ